MMRRIWMCFFAVTIWGLVSWGETGAQVAQPNEPASTNEVSTSSDTVVTGRVTSVNPLQRVLMIDERPFHLLPTTRITRGDREVVTAEELQAGDMVAGKFKPNGANKMELLSLSIKPAVGAADGGGERESGESFGGRVAEIDPTARTLTVGREKYFVLPTSKITSSNQPAQLKDIDVGESVTGRFRESAQGRAEIVSLEIPKTVGGTVAPPQSSSGGSFSGKVSSVDLTAQTLTVGGQTYAVLPITKFVLPAGQAATLRNVREEQQVSGTYRQGAEGNRELLSLQVGNATE